MGLNYQKYINRLKQKRQDNPEYALYKQSMQAMAEPMKAMNRSMQGQMSLAGGSIGAIGSTYLQGQSAMQNLATQTFGQADRSAVARNDALDNQITQMEMTRDAEAEQKNNATTKSAITIGATALGALAGTLLLPGAGTAAGAGAGAALAGGGGAAAAGAGAGAAAGTGAAIAAPVISPVIAALPSGAAAGMSGIEAAMLGAQIGAGVGGIGASFVGGTDYNALQQSIGDTLAGISAISTLNTHRQFLDTIREKYPMLTSQQDKETFLTMLTLGDYNGAMNVLNSLESPVADAEVIATAEPAVADVAAVDSAPGAVANGGKQYPSNDYDYAGWEADNPGKDINAEMEAGHLPDTYKLPNHITFSSDSKYSTTEQMGGTWEEIDNKWHFTPSEFNLKQYTPEQYQEYFAKNEPDAVLNLPSAKSEPSGGTGKTYKDWQAMVNDGTMTAEALKSRNIESYKERGYWIDAKGKKKTTKPDDYDKYYGTTAEQTPAVKPKEETNPPAFTVDDAAKATDEELDKVIIQAKYEKPESGVFAPTADEIIAPVMDSHKTVTEASFVKARTDYKYKDSYDEMFRYMAANNLSYNDPKFISWVKKKYPTVGTYDRFKKIYKAAGGQ